MALGVMETKLRAKNNHQGEREGELENNVKEIHGEFQVHILCAVIKDIHQIRTIWKGNTKAFRC